MDGPIAAVELARRRDGRHLLLLFDFDGTLTPFQPNPEGVHLDDEVRGLLAGLATKPHATVGIISGRRLPDLEKRLKIPGDVYVAGFHGLEIHTPGEAFLHPDAAAATSILRGIAESMRAHLTMLPGVSWHKGSALQWIRERIERVHGPTFTVYVGDDVTDEDAFRAVGPEGMTISASERASGAEFFVNGPDGVKRLLHSLDAPEDNRRA